MSHDLHPASPTSPDGGHQQTTPCAPITPSPIHYENRKERANPSPPHRPEGESLATPTPPSPSAGPGKMSQQIVGNHHLLPHHH